MLQTVKLNILIPLEYEKCDYIKSQEVNIKVTKEQTQNCKVAGAYSSREWFHYCFSKRPIEENFQNANSSLIMDPNYRISRIELNSVVRSAVGLHHNENAIYSLSTVNTVFRMGKIRILFTMSRISFLHLELFVSNLSEEETLKFVNAFSRITSTQPQFQYRKKISKDNEEIVRISLKNLVLNLIGVQSYISVSIPEDKINPYFQISMIGSGEYDDKQRFFESVRSLSKRASVKPIEASHIYEGKEPYISRFVGDRSVCIFGDTELCGEANLPFITDIGNGLVKTATENYLTVYVYLISLQLLINNNNINDPDIEYLLNAPTRVSDEDNIREFFEKCLWKAEWNLERMISLMHNNVQRVRENNTVGNLERLGVQMEEHDKKLNEASELLRGIDRKVDTIVDFVRTDLREYIEKEKKSLKSVEENSDKERAVSLFTQGVCAHIDSSIEELGDTIVSLERKSLELLFGNRWASMMPTSQTSLVSAGVLLKRCSDINTPDFDFSGICICATAALEAELKRVFFDGLLKYMVDKYGEPGIDDGDEVYKNWPDALLTVPKFQYIGGNYRVKRTKRFTMGKLPFLFGESGKLSDKSDIRQYQLDQSELMKSKMAEYLAEVVDDAYRNSPFDSFYASSSDGNCMTCQRGCFVWKCEKIRNDYRNKAAHVEVMTEQEAVSCYQSIICRLDKPEIYVFNAEIPGVILELFNKIDGKKLRKLLYGKKTVVSRRFRD